MASYSKISMKSSDHRGSGRRGRGPRRSNNRSRGDARPAQTAAPAKKTLWQKIVSFFKSDTKKAASAPAKARTYSDYPKTADARSSSRKPELVEVTTAKLYVGNLSYDATENDLSELFNGVGAVRSAEIVAHKHNDKSKGFGFVTMATVDEAKRAVTELHDKDFMGRKLLVSGAKSSDREPNYRG
jgi:RNA recognition motif-containing protein